MKYKDLLPHHKDDVFGWFYNQKVGLQRGVIIDFLDSIGIECFYQIGIDISNGSRDGVDYSIYFKDKIQYSGTGKTRIECFENSIKKVVELFNDGRFQNLV